MDKVENPILKPNKIAAVIAYLFMTILGGTILLMLVSLIYCNIHNLDSSILIDILAGSREEYGEYISANAIVSAIANMLNYIITLVLVAFFMRNYLVEDNLKFKDNKKYLLWYIPLTAIAFFLISFGVDALVSMSAGSSNNQNLIENMLINGGAGYIFIAVVICAPLVEELIFRKAIFSFLEKKPPIVAHVVSVVLFAVMHMLSTSFEDPGRWFLLLVPYLVSSILLCLIYEFSKRNVCASWFAHMLNNLLAFILMFI